MTIYDEMQFRFVTGRCLRRMAIPIVGYVMAITCMMLSASAYAVEVSADKAMAATEHAIDTLAGKDVVWLALAAAIFASASTIVQTVLLFRLTFAGVRAIDRMAAKPCQKDSNPWRDV